MMKFYNPFKWHIVKFNGGFVVTRRELFGARLFLDKDSNFEWCSLDRVREYCIHETEEAAIKAFEKTRMKFVRALG